MKNLHRAAKWIQAIVDVIANTQGRFIEYKLLEGQLRIYDCHMSKLKCQKRDD